MATTLAGIWLPAGVVRGNAPVWLIHPTLAWELALHRQISVDGSSGLSLYDAHDVRLRVHEHRVTLAGQPAAKRLSARHRDRLALGVQTHTLLLLSVVDANDQWQDFDIGGVRDLVLRLDYGIEHELAPRWSLGWQVGLGHVWVFLGTQRLLHVAARATFRPRPAHELRLTLAGHGVHRDADQFGSEEFPRAGVHGEGELAWSWLSRHGVGVITQARALTSFMSGEAPLYEVREEALRSPFAEASVGFLAAW